MVWDLNTMRRLNDAAETKQDELPATKEWFLERFARELVDGDLCESAYMQRRRVRIFFCHGEFFVQLSDCMIAGHFANAMLDKPSRADIEALVRILGGSETQDGT